MVPRLCVRPKPGLRRAGLAAWTAVAAAVLSWPAFAAPAPGSCTPEACGCPPPAPPQPPPAAPSALTVVYSGVSTLMFSDGQDRLLVDGFFSRPKETSLLFRRIGPDADEIRKGLGIGRPPVRAVLTAHAHHDHALDTAAVAIETGAVVVGTPSVARLVGARGVPPERICVAGPRSMAFGPYRVTPFYVEHGPSPFYLRWLLDHELTESLPGPAWFGRYRDDNNLSFLIEHGGRRILVHPSAGAHNLAGLGADVVFLGIGRLGKMSPAEAETFLRATVGPKTRLLVPIHWDRFTTPLGAPLRKSPGFLDDVDLGFARVCAYAARTPHLQVLRMDMNAGLDLASGKRTGAVAALCVNGRVRRGF